MSPAVDEVDAADLTYATFCEKYMARNRPVVIRNVVDKWFADARLWRATGGGASSANTIQFEYLRRRYGHLDVPVVDGDEETYGSREYITMKFAEYLDMVEAGKAGVKYLKDWHFVKATQNDPPLYETPEYFQDDWLNWWWDRKDSTGEDYRFVYIGPAGSETPMHHDVFRSFSWSVNIVGRKEWIFFDPEDESKLKDKFGRSLLADVTKPDYDRDLYPHAHEATPLHVTQVSGDAIFVPSGWYHQVRNLEDTISINHNWFNGYSLHAIWSFLKKEHAAVVQELTHLQDIGLVGREFRDQCQFVMRANTGINYDEFLALLKAKAADIERMLEKERVEWKREAARDHLATIREVQKEFEAYDEAGM